VRPVTYTLIAANVVNAITNWVLIFGYYGAPQLGVTGAAWATLASRLMMMIALFAVILRHERHVRPRLRDTPLSLDIGRVITLVRLGFPAGAQMLIEVGVFATATALAGRVSATSLAAHQIAIHMASVTFMIPYGLASAAAVRVGHAVGRRDPHGAVAAGWTAIAFGVAFMTAAALVFLTVPSLLIRAFSDDTEVIATGVRLLFVAAIFQLFDGLQGVTTGALRGLGDTRTAMLWNLAGHWFVGLPLGYLLCFHWGYGLVGLWWGLSLGLVICGISLIVVWRRKGIRLAL
jgi:multidrug resistance protein, MATE family